MRFDPNVAVLLAVTTGAGFLMVLLGVYKSVIEWRTKNRICPACGREIRARTCGCTQSS
jgi:NADH pyrophosphatase NudC (nudix superfamily)